MKTENQLEGEVLFYADIKLMCERVNMHLNAYKCREVLKSTNICKCRKNSHYMICKSIKFNLI